jgi:ATP-dependent exoDNAse (exonuclease V) beta subunit
MSAAPSFTAQQLDAIDRRNGPLALAANAGSGKTSVLVERYVRAVVDDGLAPGRILAITFTDRAAGELRERVRRRLAAAGEREAARASAGAFISTFHGFCTRLLRTHAVLAGLTPDFMVLDESQAQTLRDSAFDQALAGWLEDGEALELAGRFAVAGLREAIGSVYDELRSRGELAPSLPAPVARHDRRAAAAALAGAVAVVRVELAAAPGSKTIDRALERLERCAELAGADALPTPADLEDVCLRNGSRALASPACHAYEEARVAFADACADELGVPAVELLDGLLGAFGRRYEALKRARGALDFDDLELGAGRLLADHEQIAALWSERFELLMVDELQDTNPRQMALLAALERDNLFTVGDEFQSIYGFRHADVGLFRDRRAQLAAVDGALVLSTNFRSRPPLLDAVNGVFAPRFGEPFVPLVPGRSEEADWVPGAARVELLLVDTDGWEEHEAALGVELAPAPLWRRAEARLLAARVEALIASGEARAEDVVLLFRAGTAIATYEAALADRGLATLATAGGGFFARPEILDLVAYVRALANPHDEPALYGVLASPLCGCSSDTLVALALRSRALGVAVWEVALAEPPDARVAAFTARFTAARRAAADRGLGEIIAAAVVDNGYDRHLCALHSPQRRMANVHKLERLAREFEAREGRDLRRFAAALSQGRVGSLRETEAPPPADGTGAVALMTIHSAKGLEFPVVCLADLGHQSVEGHPPALLVDGSRVGLRLPTLERKTLDTLAHAELNAARRAAASAEEERIIYVAMTRARERLILSGAARFASWPNEGRTAISWLGPALLADLAARAASAGGVSECTAAGGAPLSLTLCTAELAGELLWPDADEAVAAVGEVAGPGGDRGDPAMGAPASAGVTAPARVAAPAPSTLSYTAIAEYERCPYRYHLQRIIGLDDVELAGGGGEDAAARGTAVHALLERLDFAAPRAPEEREVADAAAAAGAALAGAEDRAALAELVTAFAASPLCARLAAATDVRTEEAFAFELAGAELVRGSLDVAGRERDGTLLIVDYKTDRLDAEVDGAGLAARVQRDYGVQRLVYALAGIASGAPAVEVAHCFLRRPELVLSARFAAGERERLERELAERLGPLRAGRFEVSADPNRVRCGSCPGRARLCSHGEELTLREPGAGSGQESAVALDPLADDW